jgi:hypothetical protein
MAAAFPQAGSREMRVTAECRPVMLSDQLTTKSIAE